jgi:arylsulfatase A-like enzyme
MRQTSPAKANVMHIKGQIIMSINFCRSFFMTTVALAALALASASVTASEQSNPNIVFFITDDYGWQDTSEPMWKERTPLNKRFRTPSMERLADNGVKFTNAYTACSVCSASRISIMTGQNPVHHGTTFITGTPGRNSKTMRSAKQDNEGIQKGDILLPSLLKQAGYRTICIGKAHFGRGFSADPLNLGFDRKHYAGEWGSPIGKRCGGKDAYHVKRDGQQVHLTEALTLDAKAEISEAVKDKKPFFLYLSHYAVHAPWIVDKRFSKNYPGLKGRNLAYATMVEGADKSLGDIMDHLNMLGIAKNTLIIWTADNGGLISNKPLKGLKNDAYEGGHRVPTMVAWGAQDASLEYQKRMPLTPGRVDPRPFIHQDWMPTLLRLAGTKHPDPTQIDGYDITDLLAGKTENIRPELFFWHEPNFWAHSGPESTIREGKWKLIYFYATKKWELYDLSEDIGEKGDLLGKYPEKTKELAKKLIAHLKENKANYPTDIKSGKELPPQLP